MSKVYLVGSGIGDLNYLTIRGKELLESADVIVYDSLIPDEILTLVNEKCKKIFVGKRKGYHSYSQDEINQLLFDLTKNHKRIVRLKGGDPLLFSRGGEEIEFLNKKNISFEIIPGISSIQALEVLLEIPLTHRDFNHSLQILTGHNLKNIDFKNLAEFNGNILILMGVSNLKEICFNLIKAGKEPLTPVALISNLNKKPINCELGNLQSFSYGKFKKELPGIILIGDVLNHLGNFQQRKQRILITRPKRNFDELSMKLEDLGFITEKIPLIRIKKNKEGIFKLKESLKKIEDYNYLVFTSPTSIDIFFKLFKSLKKDLRCLKDIKICSIGPGTDKALSKFCLSSDLIPDEYSTDGIVKALKPLLKQSDRILIPRAQSIKKSFNDYLKKLAGVDEIGIYDIEEEKPDLDSIIINYDIKYITVTSSSIAKCLSSLLNDSLKENLKVYSIGKETTKSLKGFPNVIESKIFSIDGLLETIKKDVITNTFEKK